MTTLLFLFGLLLFVSGLFLLVKGEKAFLLDAENQPVARRMRAKRTFAFYGGFFLLLSLASFFLSYWPHKSFILMVLFLAAVAAALFSWQVYHLLKAILSDNNSSH